MEIYGTTQYLEFFGHGTLLIALADWRNCFSLALAFDWLPLGTLSPASLGTSDDAGDWDRNYFEAQLQRVADDDAKSLALALRTAISTRDSGKELSFRQFRAFLPIPKSSETYVIEVSDFALKGGFLIGPGWSSYPR